MLQYQVMKKLILSAILSLSTSSLFATTIKHTGLDWARAMGVEISADGAVRNANAGVGILQVDGSSLVDVLCVNLFQGISLNQTYAAASISPTSYDSNGGAAAWLMQSFLPVVDTAVEGAALQLAIWDVIHDGGDGFASGRIRSTGNTNASVLAMASQWIADAQGHSSNAAFVFTAAPGQRAFQQQLYLAAGGQPTGDVPEPGTMAMLAIGTVGVLLGAWRRRDIA